MIRFLDFCRPAAGGGLLLLACVLPISVDAQPYNGNKYTRISKARIVDMLTRPTAENLQPLTDLAPWANAAGEANLVDAGYWAWQIFIAANWPAIPQHGLNADGSLKVAGSKRGLPDVSKKFGATPDGVPGVSWPALVWETARHKVETFPGQGMPHGLEHALDHPRAANIANDFYYDDLPLYRYGPDTYVITAGAADRSPTGPVRDTTSTPWINLDENSQIGENQIYASLVQGETAYPADTTPGRLVLFLAKGDKHQYLYAVTRDWWYQDDSLKQAVENSKNFIVVYQRPPNPRPAIFGPDSGFMPDPAVPGEQDKTFVSQPTGTMEFKSAWRLLTREEAKVYERTGKSPHGHHIARIRYYRESGPDKKTFEAVDAWGALLALHIIYKTPSAPYFVFMTFEHENNMLVSHNGLSVPPETTSGGLATDAALGRTPPPAPGFEFQGDTVAPYQPAGRRRTLMSLRAPTTPNIDTVPATPDNEQRYRPGADDGTYPDVAAIGPRAYYVNTKSMTGAVSDLPGAHVEGGRIAVDRRRYVIPLNLTGPTSDIHQLIKRYGDPDQVWTHYKLVNIQWRPVDKPAGKTYRQTDYIPEATYYLSNSMVETDLVLSAFSGQFGRNLTITDYYYEKNFKEMGNPIIPSSKTFVWPPNSPNRVTKRLGDPFYNVYFGDVGGGPGHGRQANMGGCMGCHGNASVAGTDFSFIFGLPVSDLEPGQPNDEPIERAKARAIRPFLD